MRISSAKYYGVVYISLLTCIVALASSPKGPNYDGIRSMGMGNTNVAVTTDRTAIFHNPAGLGLLKDEFQLSVKPINFSVQGTFFSYLDFLRRNGNKFGDIKNLADSTLFADLDKYDGKWTKLEYLPEITLAKKNFGAGVYGVMPVNLSVETGHFIPKLGFRGQGDFVATWAVGIPLKTENNYFGIAMKYFQRTDIPTRITTYNETFEYIKKLQSVSALGIMGQISPPEHGAGFDLGMMHNINGIRIAYTLKDAFGVVGGKVMVPQLNLGGSYYFPMLASVPAMRSAIVALEITDIWGFDSRSGKYESFPKKLHAGAELDLKYLALRGGINQGYPTFGVGIEFAPLSIDYVYFTSENGYYCGQDPQVMHVLSLGLSLNVEKKHPKLSDAEAKPAL